MLKQPSGEKLRQFHIPVDEHWLKILSLAYNLHMHFINKISMLCHPRNRTYSSRHRPKITLLGSKACP